MLNLILRFFQPDVDTILKAFNKADAQLQKLVDREALTRASEGRALRAVRVQQHIKGIVA